MAEPTEPSIEAAQPECMLGFEDRDWDKLPLKYLPYHKRKYSHPESERFRLNPPLPTATPADPCEVAKCVMVAQSSGEKLILPTQQEYAREFLAEVSKVIPHETARESTVEEFGLFDYEADRLIDKLRAPKRKGGTVNLEAKEIWLNEFKKSMAVKIIDYLSVVMATRRTKRTRYIAETLLNHLCDITGQHCSLSNPRNRVQRIQVYIADRLAAWLADLMANIDKEICKEYVKHARKDKAVK